MSGACQLSLSELPQAQAAQAAQAAQLAGLEVLASPLQGVPALDAVPPEVPEHGASRWVWAHLRLSRPAGFSDSACRKDTVGRLMDRICHPNLE